MQGNILTGFNKDNQAFIFLSLCNGKVADFKGWLQIVRPFIATTAEALAFNRLFKVIRPLSWYVWSFSSSVIL